MNTKELGNFGEKLACEYLVEKGFKILCKNYRINFGEIDIIARKKRKLFSRTDKTIHFIEVKALLGQREGIFPEQHVNSKKQRKLRRLAEIWLSKNKFPSDFPYQIDIAGILIDSQSKKAKLHYFSNAVSGD